ncbi:MAG: clan AA aspartic protease [Thaumarchaeota archaeon]|nr:clan AA aspartic protease [Nitrososphaerota archaeon]
MSGFLGLTPSVQVVLKNPLLRKNYPNDGYVNAIIDTGYQGFLSIPNSIFQELGLNKLVVDERKIALADGTLSKTKGCYATLQIPHLSMKVDGFVETFPGLDEIILGVEALLETRVLLDYCAKMVRMERCISK